MQSVYYLKSKGPTTFGLIISLQVLNISETSITNFAQIFSKSIRSLQNSSGFVGSLESFAILCQSLGSLVFLGVPQSRPESPKMNWNFFRIIFRNHWNLLKQIELRWPCYPLLLSIFGRVPANDEAVPKSSTNC